MSADQWLDDFVAERHTGIAAMPLERIAAGHLAHGVVAGKVRMLMRTDLDHEAVCTMARDRIVWLAGRVEALEVALRQFAQAARSFDANAVNRDCDPCTRNGLIEAIAAAEKLV